MNFKKTIWQKRRDWVRMQEKIQAAKESAEAKKKNMENK